MKTYTYVVVNEYGNILIETAGYTIEECKANYKRLWKDDPEKIHECGCCIVQLIPVLAEGKPAGYWYQGDKKGSNET